MALALIAVLCGTAPGSCAPSLGGRWRRIGAIAAGAMALAVPQASPAQNVRITKLSDVTFGSISNLAVDASAAQNICVFSNASGRRYRVTATGSAPGGQFALASGSSLLDYDVQWNAASGQSSGIPLSPSVTQTGLVSAATQQTCNSGPATSASLILLLRSTALSSATAGSYSGTLTLIIGAD